MSPTSAVTARAISAPRRVLPSLAPIEAAILAPRGVVAGARAGQTVVLDPGQVLDVLTASAGTSRMLELRGPMIVRREFPPQMKLELFLKDLGLILDAGADVGAPLPLTALAQRLYAAAAAEGHGGDDLAVVATVLDKWHDPDR